ncbi:MAG: hypothetical protein AB1696_00685 [Planctomycetota bacterium]
MNRVLCAAVLIPIIASCEAGPNRLNYSTVGVYGECFDFCDYSVFKIRVKDDAYYRKMAERINQVHAQGKANLVGLYCFDRLNYSRPIEEYIQNADRMLQALDLKKVHAVFLSEENVTWNNGLEILNALYDHIKARHGIPVYQWYSMPMVAHPKQRADGWIIDPYGMKGDQFRKYLMKYLVLGKPVINCAWASPEGKFSGRADERLAATREQIPICREFNVPMFFYCVDPKLGSPNAWLKSDEPEVAKVREWLLDEIKKIKSMPLPGSLPELSTGRLIPVAGNAQNLYEYEERFETIGEGFIEDAWIEDFSLLRWDGDQAALYVTARRSSPPTASLTFQFSSEFEMSSVKATLEGEILKEDARASVSLRTEGMESFLGAGARGKDQRSFLLTVDTDRDAPFKGKDRGKSFQVMVTSLVGNEPGEQVFFKRLRVTCQVAPPARREIVISPDAEGRVFYFDDFQTQKFIHQCEIQNVDHLEWQRGHIGTHGVKGQKNVVALKQKFVSEAPLSNLRVSMTSTAHRALGAYNVLGLSLDGKDALVTKSTQGHENESGAYRGAVEIDASQDERFRNAKEFWVHLTMINGSAVASGKTTNRILEYRIEATAAK